jgi:hypothetical protein
MNQDTILSLKDAQKIKKMEKNNFYRWIEREKIPLYFKVPEGKNTFVASSKFLDLLIRGASSDEMRYHKLRGGVEQAEAALGIVWLRIPVREYKTLFASGVCSLHYFFEGVQPSEDGLKSVEPRLVNTYPFCREPFEVVYCLTKTFTSPPPAQKISLDEVSIHLKTPHLSPNNPPIFELPTYKYASKKLEIALQIWRDTWKKDYALLNDKAKTNRKSIEDKKNNSSIAAKKELKGLFGSDGYKGEKHSQLHTGISKLIQPDISSDNTNNWFNAPISRGIIAMIKASNHFWADHNVKQYGVDFERNDIVDYLKKTHSLKSTDAEIATRIIQPENITRGRTKL